MFAERRRRQFDADEFLFLADRPFAFVAAEIGGEFVELLALPDVARMVVALGTLNLNAQEDPRRLGSDFGGGVGAAPREQKERLRVLVRLIVHDLPLAVSISRVIKAQLLLALNCSVIQFSKWGSSVEAEIRVARVVMTIRQYWPQCLA